MRSTTLLLASLIFGAASRAGAQQAAIPSPPKTVNPLPQTTTACRGCTDDNDVKKKPLEAYDKKPSDSVVKRPATATKAVAPKPVAKKTKVASPAKKRREHPVRKRPVKHLSKAAADSVNKK